MAKSPIRMNDKSNSPGKSWLYQAYDPYLQAGVTLALALVFMLAGSFMKWAGWMTDSPRYAWMIAASFIWLYAIFNSIFSLSANNLNAYWGRAIPAFVVLMLLSGGLARGFSSLPISKAGSYRWVFFVLLFSYLLLLSIMGFVKRLVEFAEKEEWHHPRIRRKPGKKPKKKS